MLIFKFTTLSCTLYDAKWKKKKKKRKYSQPSVFARFASLDLANHEWKIFGKNNAREFQKQNLNLPQTGNHAHSIYAIFPTTFT